MARKKPQAAKSAQIPALVFCRLYMESWSLNHSMFEFSERVGLTPSQCRSRIYNYKRRGWTPPKLRHANSGPRLDKRAPIAEMNLITQEYLDQSAPLVVSSNGSGTPLLW